MNTELDTVRYRKSLHNAQKVTWDIDADVIRFRQLDADSKYLPDSLSLVTQLPFLSAGQQRLLSQIQGRTYAYLFGLIERCINAKVLEQARTHGLGDQTAVAALLKFVQEELKHQELFRRVEKLADLALPHDDGCQLRRRSDLDQIDVGGARTDLFRRDLHAGALPAQHSQRR